MGHLDPGVRRRLPMTDKGPSDTMRCSASPTHSPASIPPRRAGVEVAPAHAPSSCSGREAGATGSSVGFGDAGRATDDEHVAASGAARARHGLQ